MPGKYDFGYEVYHGSTVEWALEVVEANSEVLEFGPFNGNLTKHLQQDRSCQVDIVELDQQAGEEAKKFARDFLIGEKEGDIESFYWEKRYEGRQYDYIIFLDVIEHLIDTEKVLLHIKPFLKEDGVVLLSIPNIAYNGVLINLLNNKFPYTERGLLDCTHLRFFTYNSILDLSKKLNYSVSINALQLGIADSETNTSYDMVPQHVAHYLQQKEFANVYQYLVQLRKHSADSDSSKLKLENVDNRILACAYIQTSEDENYSEEKKVWTYIQAGNKLYAQLDISHYGAIKELRIDPMECPCYLRNISLQAETINGEKVDIPLVGSNGQQIKDAILFLTQDPQLYFGQQNKAYRYLNFSCELVSYDEEQISQLQMIYSYEQQHYQKLENKLQEELKKSNIEHLAYEKICEELSTEQAAHKKTYEELEEERTTHEKTRKELENEQVSHVKTKEKLKIKSEEYLSVCIELQNLQNTLSEVKENWENEIELRAKTEQQLGLIENDLNTILRLKDKSEEKLYLIESSKAWKFIQKVRKIKILLFG